MAPLRDPKSGRFISASQAQSIGNAVGRISIDTSGMVQGERAVAAAAKGMTTSGQQIGAALQTAGKQAAAAGTQIDQAFRGVSARFKELAAQGKTPIKTGLEDFRKVASTVNPVKEQFQQAAKAIEGAQRQLGNFYRVEADGRRSLLNLSQSANQRFRDILAAPGASTARATSVVESLLPPSLDDKFKAAGARLREKLEQGFTPVSAARSQFASPGLSDPALRQILEQRRALPGGLRPERLPQPGDFLRQLLGVRDANTQVTAQATALRQFDSPLKNIANGFRQAELSARAFARSDLGVIQRGLEGIARSSAALSAGAAAIGFVGIRSAQNLNLINARFKVFLGSTQAARAELDNIRKQADATGKPFLDLADTASQLLGLTKSYNVEVGKLVFLSQQLQVIDPTARAFDVSVATREFLSGNARSLLQRFEGLAPGPIRAIATSSDDAATKVQKLSKYLADLGFGPELLKELGEEGIFAFDRLGSEIQETIGTAFTPLLKGVLIPGSKILGDFSRVLREVSPAALTAVSGFALMAAGLAPLSFALSQAIELYGKLNKLSATGFGKKGLLATGALIVGDVAGRAGARAGLGGDFERVRAGEDPLLVVAERLTQGFILGIALLIDGFGDVVAVLNVGGNLINQALDLIFNVFKLGASFLAEGFGSIQKVLGQVVLGLGGLLQKIPGFSNEATAIEFAGLDLFQRGSNTVNEALFNRQEAQERLARGIDTNEALALGQATQLVFRKLSQDFLQGAGTALGFIPPVAEELEKVATASNLLAENLEANAGEFQETADKIAEINDGLAETAQRLKEERDIAAAREDFDFKLGRGREDADLEIRSKREEVAVTRRRNAEIARLSNEMVNITAEADGRRNDLLRESGEESIERAEDHKKRLEEIERDTNKAVANAASRLDANAVFEALQDGIDAVAKETGTFDKETAARKKSLDEQIRDIDKALLLEKDRRAAAFREQVVQEDEQRNLTHQLELEDLELRRTREDEDRELRFTRLEEDQKREDDLRKTNADKEIADLSEKLSKTAGVNQAITDKALQAYGKIGSDYISFLNFIKAEGERILKPFTNQPPRPVPPPGRNAPRPFATGGTAQGDVVVNDQGLESGFIRNQLMFFTQPTRIFSAQQTQALLSGGGGRSLHIDNITNNFGDIGGYNPDEIMGMMRQSMLDVLVAAERGG